MSCFIDFWRFLFCCYIGDDDEYERINRNLSHQRDIVSNNSHYSSRSYYQSEGEIKSKTSIPTKLPHTLNAPSIASNTTPQTREIKTKTLNPRKFPNELNVPFITPNTPVQTREIKTKTLIPTELPHTPKIHQPVSSSLPKPSLPSSKPTLSLAPSNSSDPQVKTNYILIQKATTSLTYEIPEDLKDLFKRDVVPRFFKKNVSPSTYKEYFQALLYAEDFYIEKWDGFQMKNVILELHDAAIYKKGGNHNHWNENDEKDDKVFVAFKFDSIPERRPFLLSRDFVIVQPLGKEGGPFQGLIYRVVKSNLVLVEFEEDFHHQHYSSCKYDVKFSFNRVCLKRAHQAISAASDPLFQNFLFPENNTSSSPHLIEGPLSFKRAYPVSRTRSNADESVLSESGKAIRDLTLKIYRECPSCHILICAPINKTCDVITESLQKEVAHIFRANAAFRELDGVPLEIFPNCRYKKQCFSCPPLKELRQYKVIVSTFMSAFRLHNEGIIAGHFSHIFMVDASSATEPEAMVALANLADETTKVIVSGTMGNHSSWVRSNIARKCGLMVSYFERLWQRKLYQSLDPKVITRITASGK